MNPNEKNLCIFALKLLASNLEDSFELHPPAQRMAGVCNGFELEKMIDRMIDQLATKEFWVEA